jgi:hypothetical protein
MLNPLQSISRCAARLDRLVIRHHYFSHHFIFDPACYTGLSSRIRQNRIDRCSHSLRHLTSRRRRHWSTSSHSAQSAILPRDRRNALACPGERAHSWSLARWTRPRDPCRTQHTCSLACSWQHCCERVAVSGHHEGRDREAEQRSVE